MLHKNLLIITCFLTAPLYGSENNNWPIWVKKASKIYVHTKLLQHEIDIKDTDTVCDVMGQLKEDSIIGYDSTSTLHPILKDWYFWGLFNTKGTARLTGFIKECMKTYNTDTFWLQTPAQKVKLINDNDDKSE